MQFWSAPLHLLKGGKEGSDLVKSGVKSGFSSECCCLAFVQLHFATLVPVCES